MSAEVEGFAERVGGAAIFGVFFCLLPSISLSIIHVHIIQFVGYFKDSSEHYEEAVVVCRHGVTAPL